MLSLNWLILPMKITNTRQQIETTTLPPKSQQHNLSEKVKLRWRRATKSSSYWFHARLLFYAFERCFLAWTVTVTISLRPSTLRVWGLASKHINLPAFGAVLHWVVLLLWLLSLGRKYTGHFKVISTLFSFFCFISYFALKVCSQQYVLFLQYKLFTDMEIELLSPPSKTKTTGPKLWCPKICSTKFRPILMSLRTQEKVIPTRRVVEEFLESLRS